MAELHLLSPRGFRAAGVYAGIKSKRTPDVALLVCDRPASAAAAFTTSLVQSPAVTVGREHIASGKLRGVVVNAGNANACTGKQGLRDARRMCAIAAAVLDCDAREMLPSSTGIIGHLLPMEKIERGIRGASEYLGSSLEHAHLFGDAILTTDTKRKTAAVRVKIGRDHVTLAGACKGSGMIGPRLGVSDAGAKALGLTSTGGVGSRSRGSAMTSGRGARSSRGARSLRGKQATMLAYLTTDASIAPPLLRTLLQQIVDVSFNTVTVDDHASTNDTCAILASGAAGVKIASPADAKKFSAALGEVAQSLAYQIAADGEGATKVVAITVRGAATTDAARAIARSIANSNLVKCAMNGNDPNWGRIVSAAGYAGVPFDPNRCTLKLQKTLVFRGGTPVAFDAARVSKSLDAKEVVVELDCRSGSGQATVWTCDLSKEYVTINADYHT